MSPYYNCGSLVVFLFVLMTTTLASQSLVQHLLAQGFQVEETHISWVFLGGDRAFKVKKPVDFGYLDFSTLEKRKAACEKEVELNRRLSPEVYLGVLPVNLGLDGKHHLGNSGELVDWAIQMVRQPGERRGDRLLATGGLTIGHLENLAEHLAAFHAEGRCDARTSQYGRQDAVLRNVEENFIQSRVILSNALGPDGAYRVEADLLEFIRDNPGLFQRRVEQGRVRDGHGDLRLSQIYFPEDGKAVILDCIEFNDRFRYGDVCSDIAFLAMDLAVRGREDLAENFLAAYAGASGDYELYGMVDFYACYRACVRGKIAGYAALDPEAPAAERSAAGEKARRYFEFALDRLGLPAAHKPVIAFGGGMGTGKSTLASALGHRLAAPVLASDRIRKQRAGLGLLTPREEGLWKGLYSPNRSEQVYSEIRHCAEVIAHSGRPVIVDASFRSRAQRKDVRELAFRMGRPYYLFVCRANEDTVRERLRRRALSPGISDGRESIAAEFQASWETLDPAEEAIEVDTTQPLEVCLTQVLNRIAQR